MPINVYALLTPLLLALIAGEFAYCLYRRNGYYNFQDSIANLGTAIGNQTVNVLEAWLIYRGYAWLHGLSPWRREVSPAGWLLMFLAIDFLFYWFHRAGHTINIMWAAHSPHHSSEELNYTVAARASVTQRLASFVFYAPLPLLGIPAEVVVPAVLVHHVLQFWPHTRAIGRLPAWFESVFNAPTYHRVHHGANDRYLDKNYGGVLIVWDKLFGTFEPESEPVIYGVRPPVRTWDPIAINASYYVELWRRARGISRLRDKVLLWFKPLDWLAPGESAPSGPRWRPQDQVKYQTRISPAVKAYLLAQLAPMLGLMLLVTKESSPLSSVEKLAVGALVWAGVIAWGGLLEGKNWAPRLEAARMAATLVLLVM